MYSKPVISVIVPAYNEAERIASCIRALQSQTIQFPYEIIVSDNGSGDETAIIAKTLGVRVVSAHVKGCVHALRQGVQSAKSDLIAITDADSIPPVDWLDRIYQHFKNNSDIVAVGGPFIFYDGPVWVQQFVQLMNTIYPRVLTASLCGMNMAFRKEVYHRVGGFDRSVNLQTDTEFGFRLMRYGSVVFDSQLVMCTSGRRYQSFGRAFLEVLRRVINVVAIRLTGKPFLYAFVDVR